MVVEAPVVVDLLRQTGAGQKLPRRVPIPGRSRAPEREADHGPQGKGRGQGMLRSQRRRGAVQQPVEVPVQLARPLHDEVGRSRKVRPGQQEPQGRVHVPVAGGVVQSSRGALVRLGLAQPLQVRAQVLLVQFLLKDRPARSLSLFAAAQGVKDFDSSLAPLPIQRRPAVLPLQDERPRGLAELPGPGRRRAGDGLSRPQTPGFSSPARRTVP